MNAAVSAVVAHKARADVRRKTRGNYPAVDKALDVVSSVLTRGAYWKEGLEADNDHDRDNYYNLSLDLFPNSSQ